MRFILDLERDQHRVLKLFALDNRVDAAAVLRELLRRLETDRRLAASVAKALQ